MKRYISLLFVAAAIVLAGCAPGGGNQTKALPTPQFDCGERGAPFSPTRVSWIACMNQYK